MGDHIECSKPEGLTTGGWRAINKKETRHEGNLGKKQDEMGPTCDIFGKSLALVFCGLRSPCSCLHFSFVQKYML
jgi:hypothetical protein